MLCYSSCLLLLVTSRMVLHDACTPFHYYTIQGNKALTVILKDITTNLNLIRRTITTSSINVKKQLYLSLVRSQLTYCPQFWRPRLLKDTTQLERVQRRATKNIVQDRNQDYKSRLISLQLLPLMYWFELLDIMFLVKCLKQPDESFNIFDFVSFSTSNTRFGSSGNKLQFGFQRTSNHRHFYSIALYAFGTRFLT